MTITTPSNEVYGHKFGGSAPEIYERHFVPAIGLPLATELLAAASVREGERVLDVACGTGVVARLAAERVGATGAVAGADINPAMLQVARSTRALNGRPIAWYETSAEAMPLRDASFDVVFCQLALQFIHDRAAALREMRRVLVPGGRILLNVPKPVPFFEVMHDAIARHVDPETASFVHLVFSLNDRAELERLLRGAGFRAVNVRTTTRELRLPSPADFLWQYIQCTPLAPAVMVVDEKRRACLERDVVAGWEPWTDERGMTYRQDVLVGSGRR